MQTADALRSGIKGLPGNGPNTKPGLGHRDHRYATGLPRPILACALLRPGPAFGGRDGLLRPRLRRSERPNRFQAGPPRPSPNSTSRPSWSRRNYEARPRRARRICSLPPPTPGSRSTSAGCRSVHDTRLARNPPPAGRCNRFPNSRRGLRSTNHSCGTGRRPTP